MQQTTVLQFFKPNGQTIADNVKSNHDSSDVDSFKKPPKTDTNDANSRVRESTDSVILAQLESASGGWTKQDFFVPTRFPDAVVTKLLPSHLPQVKQMTSILLPVRYPDSFFEDCLNDVVVADVSRVVLCASKPVGWIRCRIDVGNNNSHELYIQALGVLGPWRGLGLATLLLDQISQPLLLRRHNITLIYAHVWQTNEDALEWYHKRGFQRVRLEPHYYRRLKPPGAWIMQKTLH